MGDFVVDGQPWEPPESSREQGYMLTPPSLEETQTALQGETATTEPLGRALAAGQYEDGWWGHVARGIVAGAAVEQGATYEDVGLTPDLKPIQAPKLTAEEANKKYAPLGPDGKPVSITDQDIPEPVAQMLGTAKAQELDRETVLAAFSKNTAWPTRFASGLAAFMMDPINVASVFLPGVGEESALAGLGRVGISATGLAGRTTARLLSGAATGAIAQAPLSALRYEIAPYEGQEYALRDAFRDMMYGAAGGAILQAGFGALGDAFKARPDVAPVIDADPAVRADAMHGATAQIVDGREVDLEPVFAQTRSLVEALQSVAPFTLPIANEGQLRVIGEVRGLRERASAIENEIGSLPQGDVGAAEKLSRLDVLDAEIANAATAEERRALLTRRDELLTDTTPEALRGAAAPLEQRRKLEAEKTSIASRLDELANAGQPVILGVRPANIGQRSVIPYSLSDLAERQHQLYEDGFAPGVPQSEFAATKEAIYGGATAAAPMPLQAGEAAAPSIETQRTLLPIAEQPDLDRQLMQVGASLDPATLHPDDQAEIAAANQAVNEAQSTHDAYAQAAQCLIEAE